MIYRFFIILILVCIATRGIFRIGQTLVYYSTCDFWNRHTFVDIFIILKLVAAYGIYFGKNEITDKGSFIGSENVLLFKKVMATLPDFHWESVTDLLK